jgi:hypothetical protein
VYAALDSTFTLLNAEYIFQVAANFAAKLSFINSAGAGLTDISYSITDLQGKSLWSGMTDTNGYAIVFFRNLSSANVN